MKNKNLYNRLINRHYHRWEKKEQFALRLQYLPSLNFHTTVEIPITTRKGKVILFPWRYTYLRSKAF